MLLDIEDSPRSLRPPLADALRIGVWSSTRQAGSRDPAGQTPGSDRRTAWRTVKKPPTTKPERVELLCVRSLRTQQRAESQCQVIPRPRACFRGGIPLVDVYRECQLLVLSRDQIIYGEFDPGSGRTLAACLTHASRTRPLLRLGVLVANG